LAKSLASHVIQIVKLSLIVRYQEKPFTFNERFGLNPRISLQVII